MPAYDTELAPALDAGWTTATSIRSPGANRVGRAEGYAASLHPASRVWQVGVVSAGRRVRLDAQTARQVPIDDLADREVARARVWTHTASERWVEKDTLLGRIADARITAISYGNQLWITLQLDLDSSAKVKR